MLNKPSSFLVGHEIIQKYKLSSFQPGSAQIDPSHRISFCGIWIDD
jgi:hypothetical protein